MSLARAERTAVALTGWQSALPVPEGWRKGGSEGWRKGGSYSEAWGAGWEGEEALHAAELPSRWRTWSRQRHHKMRCAPQGFALTKGQRCKRPTVTPVFPSSLG